jgi:hypothetical protein
LKLPQNGFGSSSRLLYELVVMAMGSDPEPNHMIFGFEAHCSPVEPDTDGIDRFDLVYLLIM